MTGFLGSGKTSLLNRLLASVRAKDIAVLINEFGEIGLDHLLLERIDEEVLLLESGCVCCSVRDDFSQSLLRLHERREKRIIPPFRRVILETTGIADPIAIHQLLLADREIIRRYRYHHTLTTVDAVHGEDTLDRHLEAVKQVSVADRLIITKTDLADAERVSRLKNRLGRLNPVAETGHADRDPGQMLQPAEGAARDRIASGSADTPADPDITGAASPPHDGRFSTFSITWREAVDRDDLLAWLDALLLARGDSIHRLKGLVNIRDEEQPVVIQGVQHSFYPPARLRRWPHGEPKTELVFITSDFPRQAAINSLEQVLNISIGGEGATPGGAEHENAGRG